VQAPRAGEVEEEAEADGERPQDVDVPLREPARDGQFGRQRHLGEDLRGRLDVGKARVDRRRRARQRDRRPAGDAHEDELERDQTPEPPRRALAARLLVPLDARDQPGAVPRAERPHQQQGDDLHAEQGP
jgi:hypothetical protein